MVVLDPGTPPLPDGLRVHVEPVAHPGGVETGPAAGPDPASGTRAWMLAMAREAEAHAPPLPSDLAGNHDHYAHGKPNP